MNIVDDVSFWIETPEEAFNEWLFSSNYSDRTIKTYSHLFGKILSFLSSHNLSIRNINKTVYKKFITSLTSSNTSRRIYSKQLYSLFNKLCDIGVLQDNPAREIMRAEKGRAEKKLPTVLSMDEQKRFVSAIVQGKTWTEHRERLILTILFETGARCSEVATMKIEHLRLDDSPRVRFYGKGRKEREVPISDSLSAMIEQYIEDRGKRPGSYLFANKNGAVPAGNTIYMMVKKTLNRVEIVKEKLGPHVLRHTFATRQFEAGIPPAIVKNWMGHSSLTTTLIYEHVSSTESGLRPI